MAFPLFCRKRSIDLRDTALEEERITLPRLNATLFISSDAAEAQNVDSGVTFFVRRSFIEFAGSRHGLYEHRGFGADIPQDLKIVLQQSRGRRKEIRWPEDVKRRLLRYLIEGPPSRPFDCFCLVPYLLGVPHAFGEFDIGTWKATAAAAGDRFGSAECIAIMKGAQPAHCALHLWRGLFLSKLGQKGPLAVTDMEGMIIAFGGDAAIRLQISSPLIESVSIRSNRNFKFPKRL